MYVDNDICMYNTKFILNIIHYAHVAFSYIILNNIVKYCIHINNKIIS